MNKKILIGAPPKHHVLLAMDEMHGLEDIGYTCKVITYGRNDQSISNLNKLVGVVVNAFNLVFKLYNFSPDLLYLNSRFEPVATSRDFLTLLIIKTFYLKRIKVAIKTHGSDPSILEKKSFLYKKCIVPFVLKHVDIWFFLSKDEKNIIESYYPNISDKIFTTCNIIDPARSVASLEFRKRYELEENKFKILFVGRIVKEKGIFSLLKSIPNLDFRSNCTFIFVGDGPDLEELKSLALALNVSAYVRFLGFIPDAECDHFYANADLLAFPTYYNEGFPMALFKSIAVGLPAITTKIRAAKDHLNSPDNVLWVEKDSAESVTAAITKLYLNENLRNAMTKNNKVLGKEFSRAEVCLKMSEALNSIQV
ncbi:MAG: glycosyltransferase family 4 protein [Janthinobacterium lividum]